VETAGPHRRDDLRRDVVPHLVELRAEDAMGSLGRDLEETGASRRDREGVRLEVRTPHELEIPDAVVVEVHLVSRDHVGGYDGEGLRVAAEPRPEGLGITGGGRGGRGRRGGQLSTVLCGRLGLVDANETVYHEAGDG